MDMEFCVLYNEYHVTKVPWGRKIKGLFLAVTLHLETKFLTYKEKSRDYQIIRTQGPGPTTKLFRVVWERLKKK